MLSNEYSQLIKELLKEALCCLDNPPDEYSTEKLYSLLQISLDCVKMISENGRNSEMKDNFFVKELINRVTELIEYQFRIRNLSISFNITDAELQAKGNHQNFTRALLYIFMEIIKLHDRYNDFKTIYLSALEKDNNVEIEIRFTLKNLLTTSFGYAKNLIEQSGGMLCTEQSDDQMSLLISIPLYKSISRKKDTFKVLVVDDDPLIRELFKDFLHMLDVECTVCESYRNALEIIETTTPDVVIVDYNMPGMNGIEFINRASRFIDRKRFCLLTGELASTIMSRFKENEQVKVIEKPVTFSKIKEFLFEMKNPAARQQGILDM